MDIDASQITEALGYLRLIARDVAEIKRMLIKKEGGTDAKAKSVNPDGA